MGIKDFFLAPFRKSFNPPSISTPLSTIKIPPVYVCMMIVFCSFFVIVGGFIFCIVRNVPFIGAEYGPNGKVIPAWINRSGMSQYGAEGCVAAFSFTLGALSILCGYFSMLDEEKEQSKEKGKEKDKRKKQEFEVATDFKKQFACTAPVWFFLSYLILRMKIGPFIPSFTAR